MAKNSNYKNDPQKATKTEAAAVAAEKRKNRIITTICVSVALVFIVGVIAGGILLCQSGDRYGKIIIKVDFDEAPITSANFMELVNDGFYDGLTIFRAQKDFVIQGGKNDAVNLEPIVGEFSENGYKNNISHNRGVISMARTTAPNSATSQFFITLADSAKHSLDGKYAGFGYVIEGMDVVDKIAEALMNCPSDYRGFVSDNDAVKIEYAKELKDYKDPSEKDEKSSARYVEMVFVKSGK